MLFCLLAPVVFVEVLFHGYRVFWMCFVVVSSTDTVV